MSLEVQQRFLIPIKQDIGLHGADWIVGREKMLKKVATSLIISQSASEGVRYPLTEWSHCCRLSTTFNGCSIFKAALISLSVEFHRTGISLTSSINVISRALHIALSSWRGSFRCLNMRAKQRSKKRADRSSAGGAVALPVAWA